MAAGDDSREEVREMGLSLWGEELKQDSVAGIAIYKC